MIADAFSHLVKQSHAKDLDALLQQIRPEIESLYSDQDYIYYRPDVRNQWAPNYQPGGWDSSGDTDSYVEQARHYEVNDLADKLLLDTPWLQRTFQALKEKRQLIFQGPPGTGKTYVAQQIAKWYQRQGGEYRIVQFHPSYTYEDFVEGYRPILNNHQVAYELVSGPLREISHQAQEEPDRNFVLVIDEINRGNIAKILGELYFLLEYRNEQITLQYSPNELFSLPSNLLLIGTMNTADRSIALVDAALRLRFFFFDFTPDKPPSKTFSPVGWMCTIPTRPGWQIYWMQPMPRSGTGI